ncbi:MAG: hypothetical protein KJ915_11880 [Candidatus Omnitrophica bacterium]|nr:hypothetical protein [Candidatus Omnitrophota bacterium]
MLLKAWRMRAQEYAKYRETIDSVVKILPQDIDQLVVGLQNDLQKIKQETHSYIVPLRENNPNPLYAGGSLRAQAEHLSIEGSFPARIVKEQGYYANQFVAWKQAIELWKILPPLDDNDIQQIKIILSVDLKQEIDQVNLQVKAVLSSLERIKTLLDQKLRLAQADRDNRDKDSFWLVEKARVIDRFFREQQDKKQLKNAQKWLEVVLPGVVDNGMVKVDQPTPHCLIDAELREITKPIIDDYKASEAYAVMAKYLPDHHAAFLKLLTLPDLKGVKGESFFVSSEMVYVKDMELAEKIIKTMSPTGKDYAANMAKIAQYLPLMLNVTTDKEKAEYDKQAKLLNMPTEDYVKKFLNKSLEASDYSVRDLAQTSANLDKNQKKYLELKSKLQQVIIEHQRAANLELQRIAAAATQDEVKLREEEKKRKALAADSAMLDKMDANALAKYYGYVVEDARLNSQSLRNAFGDLVLIRQDLVAGKIKIDFRFLTTDKMQTVRLSEDGGNTWRKLSVAKIQSFSLEPLPGKEYDFILTG